MMQEEVHKRITALQEDIVEIRDELDRIDGHADYKALSLKRLLTAKLEELDAVRALVRLYDERLSITV